MYDSRSRLLCLCALLALPFVGCGHATSPTSPGLAPSRSTATTEAASSAGVEGGAGTTLPVTPSSRSEAAPEVQIVEPRPGGYDIEGVFDASQPVVVHWIATDADGPGPGVKSYRYLVLDLADPSTAVFFFDPDSLLRRDAPAFANWTEVDGKADQVTLPGLLADHHYVLYVTALDRRREYDPVLDLARNALWFTLVQVTGPSALLSAERPAANERQHH